MPHFEDAEGIVSLELGEEGSRVNIRVLTSDPTMAGGIPADIDTIGIQLPGSLFWTKIGIADTAWSGGASAGIINPPGGGGGGTLPIVLNDGTPCFANILAGQVPIVLNDGTPCFVNVL